MLRERWIRVEEMVVGGDGGGRRERSVRKSRNRVLKPPRAEGAG